LLGGGSLLSRKRPELKGELEPKKDPRKKKKTSARGGEHRGAGVFRSTCVRGRADLIEETKRSPSSEPPKRRGDPLVDRGLDDGNSRNYPVCLGFASNNAEEIKETKKSPAAEHSEISVHQTNGIETRPDCKSLWRASRLGKGKETLEKGKKSGIRQQDLAL